MAERAGDSCRHMTAEQLVDLVLSSAHPRLQQRCSRDQIVNLLQEKHAAYDAHGVHSLLARKYDAVEEQLEAANAAPSTFVSSLWLMVQPALSTAAEEDEPLPPQEPPNSGSSCEPPPKPSVGKQVSLGSFFGKGSVTHYSKLPDGTRVIDRVDQMTDEQLKALSRCDSRWLPQVRQNVQSRAGDGVACQGLQGHQRYRRRRRCCCHRLR